MSEKSFELDEVIQENFCIDINGEKDDIFIIAASFEDRGKAVEIYLKESYRCKNTIIYYNEDNQNYEKNMDAIEKVLKIKTENQLLKVKGNHRNIKRKNEAMSEIADFCKKYSNQEITNIAIDITSFSKIDLIVLMDYIITYIEKVNIKLIYVSPTEHGEWLSKGYSEICNVVGFSGNFDVLKPVALIILSGFEKERPVNLIEAYEPQEVFLGVSNPAVQDAFGRRNIDSQLELLDYSNVQKFDFSARDIKECYNNIENVVKEKSDQYNIVLAPLCTKLSTVACFLVAKKYPDLQLVYCYPQEYNYESYSRGIKKLFIEYL